MDIILILFIEVGRPAHYGWRHSLAGIPEKGQKGAAHDRWHHSLDYVSEERELRGRQHAFITLLPDCGWDRTSCLLQAPATLTLLPGWTGYLN